MNKKLALAWKSPWLALEALASGLAYGSGLCWASVCLLGSFRPESLVNPYWSGIPSLRNDNVGIASFILLASSLTISEFLRLQRRSDTSLVHHTPLPRIYVNLGLAATRAAVVLTTGIVIYLSINAVTHPVTLQIHATHLVNWPTEGTLRILALLTCTFSMTGLRYLEFIPTMPGA